MEQHHFLQLVFEVADPEMCCDVFIRASLVSRIENCFKEESNRETPWRCVWLLSCVQVEDRKQSYLDTYDVVLVKDETMEVPNAIMLYLTGNKWKSMEHGASDGGASGGCCSEERAGGFYTPTGLSFFSVWQTSWDEVTDAVHAHLITFC